MVYLVGLEASSHALLCIKLLLALSDGGMPAQKNCLQSWSACKALARLYSSSL